MNAENPGIYGPQTEQVLALIEVIEGLTSEQLERLTRELLDKMYRSDSRTDLPDIDTSGVDLGESILASGRQQMIHVVAKKIASKIWNTVAELDDEVYKGVASVAGQSAWEAASALIVRDLIRTSSYDALTNQWRGVIGRIHPDDADLKEAQDS